MSGQVFGEVQYLLKCFTIAGEVHARPRPHFQVGTASLREPQHDVCGRHSAGMFVGANRRAGNSGTPGEVRLTKAGLLADVTDQGRSRHTISVAKTLHMQLFIRVVPLFDNAV